MQGTSRAVEADGTQFALKNGEFHRFVSGATIGAFRVYFTGLTAATSARFLDNDATGINGVQAIEKVLDGKFYNLQGQEVKNPIKGIFIVNGKKVILK